MGEVTYVPWQPGFDALFSRGRFKDAYKFLLDIQRNPGAKYDADYWMKRALCELQDRHGLLSANASFEQAMTCPNWGGVAMERAFMRDMVIHSIRFHQRGVIADAYLEQLLDSETDPNLRACYRMLEGRLIAKNGHFTEALVAHRRARALWSKIPNADPQWVRNNDWWTFVTMIRAYGRGIKHSPLPDDYSSIFSNVMKDPRRSRRLMAQLLQLGGKPVARLVGY